MSLSRSLGHVAVFLIISVVTVNDSIVKVRAFSNLWRGPLTSHDGSNLIWQDGDDTSTPTRVGLGPRRARNRRAGAPPLCSSFLEEFDNFDRRPREDPALDPNLKGSPGDTYVKCGKCKACYALALDVVGRGRVLRCSVCQNQWFQSVERMLALPDNFLMKEWSPERINQMRDAAATMPQKSSRAGGVRLFVGNIPKRVTEEDLTTIFGNFGEVLEASLRMDEFGGSKGFAFVNLKTEEQANKAMNALNGIDIQGRAMVVRLANQAPAGPAVRGPGGPSSGRGRGGVGGGRDRRGGFQGVGRGGRRPPAGSGRG